MKLLFFISLSVCSFLLLVIVFYSSNSDNIVNPLNQNIIINKLSPQGWAFFTKPASKYKFNIYIYNDNSLSKINTINSSKEFLFGLNKGNRILPNLIDNSLPLLDQKFWLHSDSLDKIDFNEVNLISIKVPDKIKILYNNIYLLEIYNSDPWVYYSKGVKYSNDKFYIKIKFN
ncbi:hypothetical protein [Myroides odoratimimus]|uniref:hypothetical protein n=1 Tax=Myroides odoratimimus TaxID=76832 RepID=UPI0031019DA4